MKHKNKINSKSHYWLRTYCKVSKELDDDAILAKEKAARKEERERKRKEKESPKIQKEKNKKQKKGSKVIQKPNENNDESPEPSTSTGVANNKSKRNIQVNAKKIYSRCHQGNEKINMQ